MGTREEERANGEWMKGGERKDFPGQRSIQVG